MEIALDGVPLHLRDRAVCRGFYPVEHHDRRPVRWTDGHAVLVIGEAAHTRRIAFEVARVQGSRLMASSGS